MSFYKCYKACGYSTLIGLVMLFALRIWNVQTGWMIWVASGLFCGGLFLAVILIIPMMRSSKSQPGVDLPEMLVLTFEGDDTEFGSPEFRARISALATRIEERVCDGDTSAYDGDEYGEGAAHLYFNALSAKDLFAKIQSDFQDDAAIRAAIFHRVTEGHSRYRLRWTEKAT